MADVRGVLLRLLTLYLHVITYQADGTSVVSPTFQLVMAGQPAVFNCSISGSSVTPVLWQYLIAGDQSNNIRTLVSGIGGYTVDNTTTPGQSNLIINSTQLSNSGSYICNDAPFNPATPEQNGQLLVLANFTLSQNSSSISVVTAGTSVRTTCYVSFCAMIGSSSSCVDSSLIDTCISVTLSTVDSNNHLTTVNTSQTKLSITPVVLQHDYIPNSCVVPAYHCSLVGNTSLGNYVNFTYKPSITVLCPVRNLTITPNGSPLSLYVGQSLKCSADGTFNITYQWSNLMDSNSSLLIPGDVLDLSTVGVFSYQCTASNIVNAVPYNISANVTVNVTVENRAKIIIGVVVGVGSLIIIIIVVTIVAVICIKRKRRKRISAVKQYEDLPVNGIIPKAQNSAKKANSLNGTGGKSSAKNVITEKPVVDEAVVYDNIPDGYAKGHPVGQAYSADLYAEIQIKDNVKFVAAPSGEYAEANLPPQALYAEANAPARLTSSPHNVTPDNTLYAEANPSPTSPFDITLIENTLYADCNMAPPSTVSPSVSSQLLSNGQASPEVSSFDRMQKGSYNKDRALPPAPATARSLSTPSIDESSVLVGDHSATATAESIPSTNQSDEKNNRTYSVVNKVGRKLVQS